MATNGNALANYSGLNISVNELLKSEAIVCRAGRYHVNTDETCSVPYSIIESSLNRIMSVPALVVEYVSILSLPCYELDFESKLLLSREELRAVRSRQ